MAGKLLPILLGLVLLVAGALKGYLLTTQPQAVGGLLTSRWVLAGVAPFEVALGLWLLSGARARYARAVALLSFAGLLGVSVSQALAGASSCGCFAIPVSPWVTAVFDLVAVLALWMWSPGEGGAATERSHPAWSAGLAGALLLLLAVGAVAAVWHTPGRLSDEGEISGNALTVVLEPGNWVGKRFPLLKHTDIGWQLAQGRWVVVLYQRGCPSCQARLEEYQRQAEEAVGRAMAPSLAFVEVPGPAHPGGEEEEGDSSCLRGRLGSGTRWLVKVPVVVYLQDGRVLAVEGPDDE